MIIFADECWNNSSRANVVWARRSGGSELILVLWPLRGFSRVKVVGRGNGSASTKLLCSYDGYQSEFFKS